MSGPMLNDHHHPVRRRHQLKRLSKITKRHKTNILVIDYSKIFVK